VGRAEITGGGDNGLYTAAVKYNEKSVATLREAIEKELEKIAVRLAEIKIEIDDLNKQISERKSELKTLQDALHQEFERVMNTAPQVITHPESGSFLVSAGTFLPTPGIFLPSLPHDDLQSALDLTQAKFDAIPNISDKGLQQAMYNLIEHMAGTQQLMNMKTVFEKERDFLLFREEALNKRLEELSDAIEDGEPQAMWCADLSEELTGEVDTIEIKGAPDQILIGPGGASGFAQNKLANIMAMSYAQAGLAWALLPGWQKWRPTYRVGVIGSIDYDADTASVTLDAATSIAQRLNINQSTTLADIPVDYMYCNASAFEDGDRVVVEFPGQLWDTGPKVIGFETNPQTCTEYAGIIGSTSDFATLDDPFIYEWRQGQSSGTTSSHASLGSAFPTDGKLNNAYRTGKVVKFGAQWRYPWNFSHGIRYSMSLSFNMVIWDEFGNVLHTIPIRVGYGPTSSFTAKDKGVGSWGMTFSASLWQESGGGDTYMGVGGCGELREGDWVYSSTMENYQYRVLFLNNHPAYNLNLLARHYTAIHPDWAAGSGIYAGQTAWLAPDCGCNVSECTGTGIDCPSMESSPLPDYLDVADPCDVVTDKGRLYIDQSWSMEGVIAEDGITLIDSVSTLKVGEHTLPFGPFSPVNATIGAAKLSDVGGLSGKHHVGFSVFSLNTPGGQAAAITSAPWVPSVEGAKTPNTGSGYAQFYGMVCSGKET
jgi:hypothetical protein